MTHLSYFYDIFLRFLTGLVDDIEEDLPESDVPDINGWASSLLDTSAATALLEEKNACSV